MKYCFAQIAFVLVSLLSTSLLAAAIDTKQCDNAPIEPRRVTLSPNPPRFGQKMTVTVNAKPTYIISGGTFEYKVELKVTIWPFSSTYTTVDEGKDDICNHAKCPMQRRLTQIRYTRTLPSGFAETFGSGSTFRIRVKAKDQDGNLLICFTMEVKIQSLANGELVAIPLNSDAWRVIV